MAADNLTYEDLVLLTDREIQMVLREVDTRDLAVAMMGAAEGVNDRYFANVSDRIANMLRDEMVARGDVPDNEIEAVQSQIVKTVLELQAHGQIVWPKEEEKPKPKRELSAAYFAKKEQTQARLAEKSYLDMGFEEITETIVGLANVARAEGILALDALVDVDSDDMLLTGTRLAVDGTEPEFIQAILSTRMTFLIQHCVTTYRMMMEGVMSIQSGDHPRIVERKMRIFYVAPPSTRTSFEGVEIDDLKTKIENAPKALWLFEDVTDLMTDISVVAHQQGIDALVSLIPLVTCKLLKSGLSLMVNKEDPELTQIILETHLTHLEPHLETKCRMVLEGIMAIQSGDHPRFIEDKIRTFFDFD